MVALGTQFQVVKDILRVEGVRKIYGRTMALADVSFQCRSGECLAVVGLNGAGKTTLLRILAGIIRPTSGRVLIDGIDAVETPTSTALLPAENIGPEPDWTPARYLAFVQMLRGEHGGGTWEQAAHRIGLGPWLDQPIRALSSGNRRKVELVRAILHDPKVLLLDEPTRELDIPSKLEVWERVDALRGAQRALVIASHDPAEISRLADRVIVLRRGGIAWEGGRDAFRAIVPDLPRIMAA